MKNVSMKIGFAAVFAAAVLAGCSGKKTAAGGHEKVTIKFPTASASGALYAGVVSDAIGFALFAAVSVYQYVKNRVPAKKISDSEKST